MLALLAALQIAAAAPASPDSVPLVTLAEALERSAQLDPAYVAAAGQVNNAAWARRAALAVFILPAVTLSANQTHYWPPTFNFVTFTATAANTYAATIDARYDLFTGGQKVAGLAASGALLEGAHAGELQARLTTAMNTELEYYAVLSQGALTRVVEDQVHRAEQQFAIARARVRAGEAVQTDSLQLALGLARARVALVEQRGALRSAQLQLGRRIGLKGPAEAAPGDSAAPQALPFTVAEAIVRALSQGPAWRIARANERAASAQEWSRRADYLPHAALEFVGGAFSTSGFYPDQLKRSTLALTVTLPLWNNGQREMLMSQARVNHDVARAIREDLERAAWPDVTTAYDAYETSRATVVLEQDAVLVARENNRVQETRYRSGATTILDLLDAQNQLVSAEAVLVRATYTLRLARAALEVMLGERISFERNPQ